MAFFFFKQKTAYDMRISDWSSDVCSSDLRLHAGPGKACSTQRRFLFRRPGAADRVVSPRRPARACDPSADDASGGQGYRAVRRPRPARSAGERPVPRCADEHARRGNGAALDERGGRSEERRVGKEGVRTRRARCSPTISKKKHPEIIEEHTKQE